MTPSSSWCRRSQGTELKKRKLCRISFFSEPAAPAAPAVPSNNPFDPLSQDDVTIFDPSPNALPSNPAASAQKLEKSESKPDDGCKPNEAGNAAPVSAENAEEFPK